jgi:DNA polymerase III epsilon subunit family exonuclease
MVQIMTKNQPKFINDSVLANSVYEHLKKTGCSLPAQEIVREIIPIENITPGLACKMVEIILKKDSRFFFNSQNEWDLANVKTSSEKIMDLDFVILDVEITGDIRTPQLIEIAAYYLQRMKIVDKFCTFINPGRSIYPKVLRKPSGEMGRTIDTELLDSAPFFQEIIPDFFQFIGNTILVAHNAHFDLRMINLELKRIGYRKLVNKTIDTLKISRKMIPGVDTQKLPNLAYYFGISMEEHHLACEDAKALAQIFPQLMYLLIENGMDRFDQLSPFLMVK